MQQVFNCGNCGAQNYIGNKFCVDCGQGFQYTCPQCNAVIDMSFKFCPDCGILFSWDTLQETTLQEEHQVIQSKELNQVNQGPETFRQTEAVQISPGKEVEGYSQQREAEKVDQGKQEIRYKEQSENKTPGKKRTIWLIAFIVVVLLIIAAFIVDMFLL